MKYKIYVELAFDDKAPALAIYNYALKKLPLAVVIKPNEPGEERGRIVLHRCPHSDPSHGVCEVVTSKLVKFPTAV